MRKRKDLIGGQLKQALEVLVFLFYRVLTFHSKFALPKGYFKVIPSK